jgi:hypothetical protein
MDKKFKIVFPNNFRINNLVNPEIRKILVQTLFQAQLITYLKLLKKPKGLLINFNCENITKSLIPIVTDEFAKLPEK